MDKPAFVVSPILLISLAITVMVGVATVTYRIGQRNSNTTSAAPPASSKPQPSISASPTASMAVSSPSPKITLDQLKNMSYLAMNGQQVKLNNGQAQYVFGGGVGKDGKSFSEQGSMSLIESGTKIGDMNGDGIDDAVVSLGQNTGGTGYFDSLALVTMQDGQLKVVTYGGGDDGDRATIKSSNIEAGIFTLNELVAGNGEPSCCGTTPAYFKYKLTGTNLIKVESTDLSTTKTFSDAKLGISFNYKKTWNVSMVTDSIEAVQSRVTVTETGLQPKIIINSHRDLGSVAQDMHANPAQTLKDMVENKSMNHAQLLGTQTIDGSVVYQLKEPGLVNYYTLYFQHGSTYYSVHTSSAEDFSVASIFSADENAMINSIKFL